MRPIFLAMAAASFAWAQAQYKVPATCTLELVQQLDLTCAVDSPCPLYLELSDVELVGERLILAGNIHTTDTTLDSVLLVSDDGGKSWTEGHARIPAGVLADIQFLDFESGWISGHLLRSDAREPFFLITGDGGKTWRKRPIYSEPKSGAIEQFRFDSRTSGKVTVDRGQGAERAVRYELWESMTSGDSWNVRQVDSRPIPLPGGPRAETKAIRIRPDAKSKSYQIERSEGNRWRAVASLAVNVGECKPEPPETKEQPPVVDEPPPAAPPASPPKGKKE